MSILSPNNLERNQNWKSLSHTARLLLYVIANLTDINGDGAPTLLKLQRVSGIKSKTTLLACIKTLEKSGLISKFTYWVAFANPPKRKTAYHVSDDIRLQSPIGPVAGPTVNRVQETKKSRKVDQFPIGPEIVPAIGPVAGPVKDSRKDIKDILSDHSFSIREDNQTNDEDSRSGEEDQEVVSPLLIADVTRPPSGRRLSPEELEEQNKKAEDIPW